jgi:hypothetical protein
VFIDTETLASKTQQEKVANAKLQAEIKKADSLNIANQAQEAIEKEPAFNQSK